MRCTSPQLVDRFCRTCGGAGLEGAVLRNRRTPESAAPHLHAAFRGAIPARSRGQVAAATYHQVWWPTHDHLVYTSDHEADGPLWDRACSHVHRPGHPRPLTSWDEALDALDADDDAQPAHVVRFGEQCKPKGILGGTEEAGRHIGYLTKYLTKSISELIEPDTAAQRQHHDRLHAELAITPCSQRCPVWLRYGIVPKGANSKTLAGPVQGQGTPPQHPRAARAPGAGRRGNGPARPSRTIGATVRNLFGNSSPTPGSANLCVIRPEW